MKVFINIDNFEYDIHSLVKAFYQYEDVTLVVEEAMEVGDFSCMKRGDEADESDNSDAIFVVYYPDRVAVYGADAGNEDVPAYDGDDAEIMPGGSANPVIFPNGKSLIGFTKSVAGLERAEVKNVLKKLLYRLLCRICGRTLPWGTLTGIRPTKIPMKMMNEGYSDSEIVSYMKDTYFTGDEKIELAMRIAKREKKILEDIDGENGVSLYVGIPFCPTTCLYCSFTSYPISRFKGMVDSYLTALLHEIAEGAKLVSDKRINSVYIGGGTPTTLEPDQLERLINGIKASFDLSTSSEFTVEAGRPDSITEDKLNTLKRLGVDRISINPQTMNDATLKVIGRNHNSDQIREAFALARRAGFENINMDIILGLPGEREEMVNHTLEEIKKLEPDSLTIHSMAIKRAAGMAQYLSEHDELKSVNTPEMMDIAMKGALSMGMEPYYLYRQKNMAGNYENIGYAKPGKSGIYNILIMEEVQSILAFGAGTITKRVFGDGRIERCDNVKDVVLYISKIEEMLERKKSLFALTSR